VLALIVLGTAQLLAPASPASADPTVGPDAYDEASAQDYVDTYAQRHGLPGVAFAVVKDGELVTTGATGDTTATRPMAVGSVSKTFTAFAVLQLVDQGKVDLDAPVTDYVPRFRVSGADVSTITVRMLLSHTSGLPNPTLVEATGNLERDVAAIADLELASSPGTRYRYSNLGYRALALLVQEVSGEEFDSYLATHVFEPLGMDDTVSVISATPRDGLDSGHVTAYGTSLPTTGIPTDVGGSGGVISTAEDMGRWLGMQQRGGVADDGTRLLSADLVDQSHTPQPGAERYGLGWQQTSTAEPARVGHDGTLAHYSSRADLVPSSGYGVVVMLDSFTPTFEHPFAISTGLTAISEGQTPQLGTPVATIIDAVLAVITVGILALGLRGVLRAEPWVRRRRSRSRWRFLARQGLNLVAPVLAAWVFLGLTIGPGNPATPLSPVLLWPAAAFLLLAAAAVGTAVLVARGLQWQRQRPAPTPGDGPRDSDAAEGAEGV
jgi:CubicO group peptidase (beta-lactamase class C family)